MGAAWVPYQSLTLSLGLAGRVFWVLCLILASWGPGWAGIQVFLYRIRILLTSVCVCVVGYHEGRGTGQAE